MRWLTLLANFTLALAIPTFQTDDELSPRDLGNTADTRSPVLPQQLGFSGDVTQCQGYTLSNLQTTSTGGLLAHLSLLSSCNAYGTDISSLTLSVEYDTPTRLHVHIYDTALHQFQLPDDIWPRPSSSPAPAQSDLSFNYTSDPFEFWVTRKSDNEIIFDTRASKVPTYEDQVQIQGNYSNYTVMPKQVLVFEDQYLQIASAMPAGSNVYGLGEVIGGSGYRRNSSATVQTFWARDIGDPVDENVYGSHAMYMEVRAPKKAHGVFLLNSNGMDVILRDGVIQYRAIGGTLDFYFVSGPTPNDVASQYAQLVGLPQQMPYWGFGFHLCRWGYGSVNETRGAVQKMRDAGIPLEVQWNDIDWMRRYREFQFDENFAPAEYKAFVDELHANNQHYIPIIDAAIGILYNDSDTFDVYTRGHELGVWITNADGTEYIGSVWPGYTVFPDWFNPKMQQVWTEAFTNLSQTVDFDGIWLDMNEPSSFVDGSQANSTHELNRTQSDYAYVPPPIIIDFPEGYWPNISGYSGNITVNGTRTYGQNGTAPKNTALRKRSHSVPVEQLQRSLDEKLKAQERDLAPRTSTNKRQPVPALVEKRRTSGFVPQIPFVDEPPYPIRNQAGRLSRNTVSPNATHYGGLQEYSVHNIWGYMEEIATNNMLQTLKPGLRPLIIARSTFAGIGRKSAHWLGDNYSTWAYMKRSIQGVLQFNLFAVPMVGPDTCGFNGNTDEELCNRWMQLSAFFPFFRNHNTKGAISQEPYAWDSVRDASTKAIYARYSLLPYWETLFAEASQTGLPPVRALFHEFTDEGLYDIDAQFLVGPALLVTPVLQPNETTVTGTFPTSGGTGWYSFWDHSKLDTSKGSEVELYAPLGDIPVHVRSGSVVLMRDEPQYTLTETRAGAFGLLVVLDSSGSAQGQAKLDDGVSLAQGAQTCLNFKASKGSLSNAVQSGYYHIDQPLESVTILGVWQEPSKVSLDGKEVDGVQYDGSKGEVVVKGLKGDMNSGWTLTWA